jgi:uncharacterized surface protein with fasciclin (FAS1) repeats
MNDMMRKILILVLSGLAFLSCQRDIEKFQRPDWLEGKLYTQIKQIPDVDIFTQCMEITGYDTIIDQAGSYTVFVPDNNAFETYFSAHPEYGSVGDMPMQELLKLVRNHIIQNPWSRFQLQTLDINGWIDKKDPYNDEPWGYKRQTLHRDDNRKYFIHIDSRDITTIVDSTESTDSRLVFSEYRKYAPVFFDEYMELARVTSSDYNFYFNRSFEAGNLFYVNAKLYPDKDAYAENGFIYVVDQVVEPMKNAEQLLESSANGHSYKRFLETLHLFPQFTENVEATNKQPGAELGQDVPTLYDLSYPTLAFDIHKEITGEGRDRVNTTNTIRYHYGIVAPTDAAMQWLIDNVVTSNSGYPHWPSYGTVPENIKRIIVNTHMSEFPIYLSDVRNGFVNGERDSVYMDEGDIIEKFYGSNATFIGSDKPLIPRAFSSVTGPVYLRPGFSYMMYAMEYANVLSAVKRFGTDYSFFITQDTRLAFDSSLYAAPHPIRTGQYEVYSFDKSYRPARKTNRNRYEITQLIFNQVGVRRFSGVPRKEFVKNLAGNYICFNSVENKVTGGVPVKLGWRGDSTIYLTPTKLEEPTDNGESYEVEGFFTFTGSKIYDIALRYTHFFNLMLKAGLVDTDYGVLNFLNESEYHTVFVPSVRALNNYNTDTLTRTELQNFIKYHFVRGEHIFTDGNLPSGDYPTLRRDESSTVYNTRYSTVNVQTGTDFIEVYNGEGRVYTIEENDSTTNILSARNTLQNQNTSLENYVTNAVFHEIDTVILKR